jgi:hypothetical protein
MMHNGWGNVQYRVKSIDQVNRSISFERGGYQHGRDGGSAPFWIENQRELLDVPGEWWLDVSAGKLYVYPNSTAEGTASGGGAAAPPAHLAAAVITTVVAINGSAPDAPAVNISFHGVWFGQTAPTYLHPYERPISGDWAIHRGGSVLVTNAVDASFVGCNFTMTGGNALTFSRSVRGGGVSQSEFFSIGDSAVVAYGDIDWSTGDARARTYPSGLVIEQNLIHEIGVWGMMLVFE